MEKNRIEKNKGKIEVKYIVLLQCLLLFLSFSGVSIKYAALFPAFSFKWCLFYAISIGILGVYAILWQQVLKKIPLTIAFCNKAVGIIWAMLWGSILFHEAIEINMIIGAVIVLSGVVLVVTSNE